MRVELDPVERGVAIRNRLAQRGQPAKGRVTVRRGLVRGRSESVDDVLRRPNLRIPAPKVDDRLPPECRVPGNLSEQRSEVLLGQPFDAVWGRAHGAIVFSRACPAGRAIVPAGG